MNGNVQEQQEQIGKDASIEFKVGDSQFFVISAQTSEKFLDQKTLESLYKELIVEGFGSAFASSKHTLRLVSGYSVFFKRNKQENKNEINDEQRKKVLQRISHWAGLLQSAFSRFKEGFSSRAIEEFKELFRRKFGGEVDSEFFNIFTGYEFLSFISNMHEIILNISVDCFVKPDDVDEFVYNCINLCSLNKSFKDIFRDDNGKDYTEDAKKIFNDLGFLRSFFKISVWHEDMDGQLDNKEERGFELDWIKQTKDLENKSIFHQDSIKKIVGNVKEEDLNLDENLRKELIEILDPIIDIDGLFYNDGGLAAAKAFNPVEANKNLLFADKMVKKISDLKSKIDNSLKEMLEKVIYEYEERNDKKLVKKSVKFGELLDKVNSYWTAYRLFQLRVSGEYDIPESDDRTKKLESIKNKILDIYKGNQNAPEAESIINMLDSMDEDNLKKFEGYATGISNEFDKEKLSKLSKVLQAAKQDTIIEAMTCKSREQVEKEFFNGKKSTVLHYMECFGLENSDTPYNTNIRIGKYLKDNEFMKFIMGSEEAKYTPKDIVILKNPGMALAVEEYKLSKGKRVLTYCIDDFLPKYEDRLFLSKLNNENRSIFIEFCYEIGAKKFDGYNIKAVFIKEFIQQIAGVLNKVEDVNKEFDKYDFDLLARKFSKRCEDWKLDDIDKAVRDCINNETDLGGINRLHLKNSGQEIVFDDQQQLLFDSLMAIKQPPVTYGKSKGVFIGSSVALGLVAVGAAVLGAAGLHEAHFAVVAVGFLSKPIALAVCAAIGLALLASSVVSAIFLNKGIKKEITRLDRESRGPESIQRQSEIDIKKIMDIPLAEHKRTELEHRKTRLLKRVNELEDKIENVDKEVDSLIEKIGGKVQEVQEIKKDLEEKAKEGMRCSDMLEEIKNIETEIGGVKQSLQEIKENFEIIKNNLKKEFITGGGIKHRKSIKEMLDSTDPFYLVFHIEDLEKNFENQKAESQVEDSEKLVKEKTAVFKSIDVKISRLGHQFKKVKKEFESEAKQNKEFLDEFFSGEETENKEVIQKEIEEINEAVSLFVETCKNFTSKEKNETLEAIQHNYLELKREIKKVEEKIKKELLHPDDRKKLKEEIRKSEAGLIDDLDTVDRAPFKTEIKIIESNIESFESQLNQYKKSGNAELGISMDQFYNNEIKGIIDKVTGDIEKSAFIFPENKAEIKQKLKTLSEKASSKYLSKQKCIYEIKEENEQLAAEEEELEELKSEVLKKHKSGDINFGSKSTSLNSSKHSSSKALPSVGSNWDNKKNRDDFSIKMKTYTL